MLLDLNQAHDAGLRLLDLNDLALQATKSVQLRSWFLFLAYWSDSESRFYYFGSYSIDLVRYIYIDASTLLHKYGYMFAGSFLR